MKNMHMKPIYVPNYVAEDFIRALPNLRGNNDGAELHLQRIYKLINAALNFIEWPDWEIDGHPYHSIYDNEPYGIECIDAIFYIYAKQRGQRGVLAVFKRSDLAAEYFVWLVSKGTRTIDWGLFLDMEP